MVPAPLRRDARQNIEKLRQAASAVFTKRGLGAPLEEIAQQAGVSTGTLYNRFGSREALIDAVISDLVGERLAAVISHAQVRDTPWLRFEDFVLGLGALQAECPAASDVIALRYPDAQELAGLCTLARNNAETLMRDAHAAGALRGEFSAADLSAILTANAAVVAATSEIDPEAWRRHLGFVLDGVKSP